MVDTRLHFEMVKKVAKYLNRVPPLSIPHIAILLGKDPKQVYRWKAQAEKRGLLKIDTLSTGQPRQR